MSRYENIVAELAERVPELADECQTDVFTFLEQCQLGSKEPLSEADIEYLRALQISNPEQCKDEINPPLAYFVFEVNLFRFLLDLLNNSERHQRLQEIMDWLETLQGDEEQKVRDLVAISFSEQLLGNKPNYLPEFLPFMGENLRESCRGCFSSLRVSDENKKLLE